jgi:hypothetical protein
MDGQRFDVWTRHIGAITSRRETLGALAGAVLASFGTLAAGARKQKHDGKGHEKSRHHRKRGDNDTERDTSGSAGHDVAAAGKKKKKKCVKAGGSCKKPKKGKAKKCCAGLRCDGQSQRCVEAGGDACPNETRDCDGGCVPQGTPCCPNGERPCDGICVTGTVACVSEFAQCMAPVAADWYAAVDGCAAACDDPEAAACRSCLEGVLEAFADPLARCYRITCTDATWEAAAEQADERAVSPLRPCDSNQLLRCRRLAAISALGQTPAQTGLGLIESPVGALGGFLMGLGQFDADVRGCEKQFGCPAGDCDPDHDVCCGDTWNCKYYDPDTGACTRTCARDSYCDRVTRTCTPRCKSCYSYISDGKLPCGQRSNNCGSTITCTCPGSWRCHSGFCERETCPSPGRRSRSGRAAGDECCLPKTCAELGKTCGTWDDGCGGTITCGECWSADRPNAFCDYNTGACQCYPLANCASCGMQPDGCGGLFDCGGCADPNRPNAYCGANGYCACEPDTCDSLGKTCGYWIDGCGGTMWCSPPELLCGNGTGDDQLCCAEGQTCCGLDWENSTCCNWPACHRWPGGKPKGCCPEIQQCAATDGRKLCCGDGWRCRGAGDTSHPSENCCVPSGGGDAALHLDSTLCCSGRLASMWPHVCA